MENVKRRKLSYKKNLLQNIFYENLLTEQQKFLEKKILSLQDICHLISEIIYKHTDNIRVKSCEYLEK